MLDQEIEIPSFDDDEDFVNALEERHEIHGSYGMPFQQQFSCPKCPKFKNTDAYQLKNHLLREFNFKR